jgi:hypothetical protein
VTCRDGARRCWYQEVTKRRDWRQDDKGVLLALMPHVARFPLVSVADHARQRHHAVMSKEARTELVDEFAHCVVAQGQAIAKGDAASGNTFAKRYVAAFQMLRLQGHHTACERICAQVAPRPGQDREAHTGPRLVRDRPLDCGQPAKLTQDTATSKAVEATTHTALRA